MQTTYVTWQGNSSGGGSMPVNPHYAYGNGELKGILTWTGEGDPPDELWVKIHLKATSAGDPVSAVNGWTDPAVIVNGEKISEGFHIKRYSVDGDGKVTVKFNLTAMAQDDPGPNASSSIFCEMNITPTDRKVTLQRSDQGVQIVEDDGTTYHAPTRAAGFRNFTLVLPEHMITITATLEGTWSQSMQLINGQFQMAPNVTSTWNTLDDIWSPRLVPFTTVSGFISLFASQDNAIHAADVSPGANSTTKVVIKDLGDGYTIELTYDWFIHRMYEGWEEDHVEIDLDIETTGPTAYFNTASDSVTFTGSTTATYSYMTSVTAMLSAQLKFELPTNLMYVSEVAIGASLGQTKSETVGTTVGQEWSVPCNVMTGEKEEWRTPLPGFFTACIVWKYNLHVGTMDGWDDEGNEVTDEYFDYAPHSSATLVFVALPEDYVSSTYGG